ncbi:glycoside hydrolase family 99-like domain-containing protein [Mariniflexile litorale]|uniref:Glycoside hydrolase family 99-like domain-containing protein n=1 Tax=Mariniflexile litorale TaxID=3045158 RepID=A0AAU7ED90_9FLAO|nr:glycoside hydrolase family 99-like domain-containing protein [Mariniflexile sp. KMM 9835]MDQ8212223.1 glycoside hydrolase family 99-like domain-containing protein [Mariniflexile sp. KMM 9835]
MKLRPIAFVLPQFHPIPENDAWWGKGFTEWTNVTKATPLFEGHYQPHLPTDLGFYDLRLPEARKAQADLAKEHGIHGFCYYHYWFNGKRLLDQPIDGMLEQKDLDMPFMLCWANENWNRRWDGMENEILIKQEYSFKDDVNHMRWLCTNVFSDNRYIKVDGKPVFVIYRYNLFPDIEKTLKVWRDIAKNEFGFKDLYLCFTESFGDITQPAKIGFDAAIEFSPHAVIKNKIKSITTHSVFNIFKKQKKSLKIDFRDFELGVKNCMERPSPDYKLYRGITPSWDNTSRKKENWIVAKESSPELYFKWLKHVVDNFKPYSKEENFVFINAMNEWAEGNHLEPCIKYGRAYLEATKKALEI